jgi:hypothetical protein
MVESLQDVVNDIEARVDLQDGDVVVDIGCNDGTMLSQYTNKNLFKVGYDPALNLTSKAAKQCDEFFNTYFGGDDTYTGWAAKVVTSVAMFYDLEDPNKFVEKVKECLDFDGIWVVQLADLISMLKANAFDAICHEHLEYYSLGTLCYLMDQHELEVFDVSKNDVNGGSLRVFVGWKGDHEVSDNVVIQLREEMKYIILPNADPFVYFAEQVNMVRDKTRALVHLLNAEGNTIYVLGASTKGNTLLQYFDLTSEDIPFAAEVNPDKFGKRTVGTNILIISEKEAIGRQPDYFLVLPWHFRDGLVEKVKAAGYKGKFIFPLPNVEIVE